MVWAAMQGEMERHGLWVTNVTPHRPLGLAHWVPNQLPLLATGPLSEPSDTFQHRCNTFLVSLRKKKIPRSADGFNRLWKVKLTGTQSSYITGANGSAKDDGLIQEQGVLASFARLHDSFVLIH